MTGSESQHERFDRATEVTTASNRACGLVMAAALVIVGGVVLYGGDPSALCWLGGGAAFLALAIAFSWALTPLIPTLVERASRWEISKSAATRLIAARPGTGSSTERGKSSPSVRAIGPPSGKLNEVWHKAPASA